MRIGVVAIDSQLPMLGPIEGVTRDLQLKVGSEPPGHDIRHLLSFQKSLVAGPGFEPGISGTEAADATNAPAVPLSPVIKYIATMYIPTNNVTSKKVSI